MTGDDRISRERGDAHNDGGNEVVLQHRVQHLVYHSLTHTVVTAPGAKDSDRLQRQLHARLIRQGAVEEREDDGGASLDDAVEAGF